MEATKLVGIVAGWKPVALVSICDRVPDNDIK